MIIRKKSELPCRCPKFQYLHLTTLQKWWSKINVTGIGLLMLCSMLIAFPTGKNLIYIPNLQKENKSNIQYQHTIKDPFFVYNNKQQLLYYCNNNYNLGYIKQIPIHFTYHSMLTEKLLDTNQWNLKLTILGNNDTACVFMCGRVSSVVKCGGEWEWD